MNGIDPVVITGKDIYDAVTKLAADVSHVPSQVQDHEGRIRYLERAVWIYTGAAGFTSAIITGVIVSALNGSLL